MTAKAIEEMVRRLEEEVAALSGIPVKCFESGQVHTSDIPAVGQRARDAANTAPLRLAAHGETK